MNHIFFFPFSDALALYTPLDVSVRISTSIYHCFYILNDHHVSHPASFLLFSFVVLHLLGLPAF